MKNLLEISKIVTKKKVKKIEIFDEQSLKNTKSKFNEFYELLMAGKFKNDRDAASLLYSCSPTDDKYRQLKSRFKKRLLNTLFFLDINIPATSNFERANYSCNKDWSLVQILLSNGASETAKTMARQILTTSIKYSFSDLIIASSRYLRSQSAESANLTDYKKYDAIFQEYSQIYQAEITSSEIFEKVLLLHTLGSKSDTHERDKLDDYCNQLVSISEQYESPVIFYNMYMSWAYRYDLEHNWSDAIAVCENADEYVKSNPKYYHDKKMAEIQILQMSAYIHLKDFKNGKTCAESCLKKITIGSLLWFRFLDMYYLLAIHCKEYLQAFAIYKQAVHQSKFRRLHISVKEKWSLYDIYNNFIIEYYKNEMPALISMKNGKFKLSTFLNDPVLYPKTQKTLEAHKLIAQILFLFNKKNYSTIAEKIDRLRTLVKRNQKKENWSRMNSFVNVIVQLNRSEFQKIKSPVINKQLTSLSNEKFHYRGSLETLEIIPFEDICEILLKEIS